VRSRLRPRPPTIPATRPAFPVRPCSTRTACQRPAGCTTLPENRRMMDRLHCWRPLVRPA